MRRMMMTMAAALAGVAASAAGAVNASSGGLTTAITHINDFEAITGPALLAASSHTQDQITVRYVGNSEAGGIVTDYQPNGRRSWYNFGRGVNFVEITTPFLVSGMQVAIGTGWSCCAITNFEVLKGGTVVNQGNFASLKFDFDGYDIYSFSGGLFDTLRLSSTVGASAIGSVVFDSMALDDVKVSRAVAAIPEPASWAMLITGFGLVGQLARRRAGVAAARS